MIRCSLVAGTDRVQATFTVHLVGDVYPVAVAGDFNAWDANADPFVRAGGICTATVMLHRRRRYAFRYLAEDGAWFNDDEADAYEANTMGGTNSILDLTASS